MTALTAESLAPCPFCGQRLVELSDHHGSWFGHKSWPTGDCYEEVAQIHDEDDARRWNTRADPKRLP